jgi:dolichol-phosphate mannosyltransferase
MEEDKLNYEFVLVDDGSSDVTWNEIVQMSSENKQITAIRLSRNFGKEAALCAGLDAAKGDACIVMDADLQHPPHIIPEMVRLWCEEGYDVVEGVKSSRGKESLLSKVCALTFYKLLKRFANLDLMGASDFKLLDRKVVEAWSQFKEKITFFRGMSAWVGFKRTTIPFAVNPRTDGKTRWSGKKLFKLAVYAISSYSSIPLQIVTIIGITFLIGSFILGIQTLYMKFSGKAVSGFSTVILLLLIIGSGLMISLGIIGLYIAKIYDEVKQRPRYLVSERINTAKYKKVIEI